MKTKVIAEIGVNHNGNIDIAKKLVEGAKLSGADIVKFQYFKAEELVTKNAKSTDYQKANAGINNQYELLKSLEVSIEQLKEIKLFCDGLGVEFLCTSFSEYGLKELCKLGMKKIKIPSGEINNKPLLLAASKLDKEIYLSTGMSNIQEIKEAVKILKDNLNKNITVMHCTSLYPAPSDSLNINALVDIKNNITNNIGYSDHSEGYLASCLAITLGASVIEKHITLNKNDKGPDHSASLDLQYFSEYVEKIRETEVMLGSKFKIIDKREEKIKALVRKS
ncbi:N-acetylneuraminate synthase family protein, partial [Alphaproteobacteria bacterium]|nr:N-acetylneuraminate synthase family protein [Alphaproteobacteria bacterium]